MLPDESDVCGLLYVDDWLWSFLLQSFWVDAIFVLVTMLALGLPVKWKKLAAGIALVWIGFR